MRTETSNVSSSDSETDDVRTPTLPEARERRRNSSVVEGQSEISTAPPETLDNNRKELQKADRFVHKKRSDKTDNKHSNKTGPGPSNCVIPDSNNKVRSSRSMELLPTMSLTHSSIDTDSETAEPLKNNQLRTGGPLSPLNGSCPALSRNLTVFDVDSASEQPNPTNTYHTTQQQDLNRSRNDVSKYETKGSEQCYNGPKPNLRNTEVVKNGASNDVSKNSEGQDVMVVYDGPQVKTPSPIQSPSRTNAYLLSGSLGDRETRTDRNLNNQSSSYHGNSGSQDDIHSPTRKQNQENHQSRRNDTDQNQRKPRNQPHQSREDNTSSHGERSQPRPVDRRLAHLPILNQMRSKGDNTRALQSENRDRLGGRNNNSETESQKHSNPNQSGHHRNDRHRSEQTDHPRHERPRQDHTGQPRYDRNPSRSDQTDLHNRASGPNPSHHAGHDRNRSRPGYDGRHSNQRNISRPDETGHYRNDRHISRPDQSQYHGNQNVDSHQRQAHESENVRHGDNDPIQGGPSSNSPSHRGVSNEGSDRTVQAGLPPAAMAIGNNDGAVNTTQDPGSGDSVGYLNLYRMGEEEDDIYV